MAYIRMYEMIRASHVVVCPLVFNLLCRLSQQAGVLKLIKKAQV